MAGGESSRFFPFNGIHKSFFKIAGKTILQRTVESVRKADPSEILLVLGSKNFEKEKQICENIPAFSGVKFIKEEKPLGQADAILSAREHIKGDFFVINASQINFHSLAESFDEVHKPEDLVTVGISPTDTPSKYGIVDIKDDRICAVIEKPESGKEPSNMRLVGIYLLSESFLNDLSSTPVSDCQLETAINNASKKGLVGSVRIPGQTPSLKYPWDIFKMKDIILPEIGGGVNPGATVEKTAVLRGDGIFIEKGAHIYDFALIEGPCFIGENAVVGSYSQVRGGTVIESDGQVERYCDVKNTVIGEGSHVHSGFLGDSIIGANCRIGAGFITANKKLDRSPVEVKVKGEKVDSGLIRLGVFMGDGVKVGIRVSAMPGTIIGKGSSVYPNVTLHGTYDTESVLED